MRQGPLKYHRLILACECSGGALGITRPTSDDASDPAAESTAKIDDQNDQENQANPTAAHRRTAEIKSAAAEQQQNKDN